MPQRTFHCRRPAVWAGLTVLLGCACGGAGSAGAERGDEIAGGGYEQDAGALPEATTDRGEKHPGIDAEVEDAHELDEASDARDLDEASDARDLDEASDARDGGGGGAGSDAPACAPATFTSRFRSAVPQQNPYTCASALPEVVVADGQAARQAVRAFIAGVRGFAPDDFAVEQVDCGTANSSGCARRFQHDLYKSNGTLGEALFPLAEELERCASSVSETIWVATVKGLTYPADVCLSGIADGHLIGMVMFNDLQNCP